MHMPRVAMAGLALLLLAAAAAQALGGWPHFRETLLEEGIASHTVSAVGAGWLFGAALLAGLAAVCLVAALRRELRVSPLDLAIAVAVVFIGFGVLGLWLRGNSHYGNFVAIGVLALPLAWMVRRPRSR